MQLNFIFKSFAILIFSSSLFGSKIFGRIHNKHHGVIFNRVEEAIKNNNFKKALNILIKEFKNKRKSSAQYYFLLARIQQENKNNTNALINYTIAIEKDKRNFKAWNNRGLVKGSLKDFKGALTDFSEAINLNKNFEAAYINRGVTYSANLLPNKAISDFNKAIEINPKSIEGYTNRALAHQYLKNNDQLCLDLKMLKSLGNTKVDEWIKEYCK